MDSERFYPHRPRVPIACHVERGSAGTPARSRTPVPVATSKQHRPSTSSSLRCCTFLPAALDPPFAPDVRALHVASTPADVGKRLRGAAKIPVCVVAGRPENPTAPAPFLLCPGLSAAQLPPTPLRGGKSRINPHLKPAIRLEFPAIHHCGPSGVLVISSSTPAIFEQRITRISVRPAIQLTDWTLGHASAVAAMLGMVPAHHTSFQRLRTRSAHPSAFVERRSQRESSPIIPLPPARAIAAALATAAAGRRRLSALPLRGVVAHFGLSQRPKPAPLLPGRH